MSTDNYIKDMYKMVDAMDATGLAAMMTQEASFRFANIPAVKGRAAIIEFLDNFFQSIKSIAHDHLEDWSIADTRFATGRVTYTRHDGSQLQVPFSVVLKMQGKLINEYLVFVDASDLYRQ